jgi:hypothetical protein
MGPVSSVLSASPGGPGIARAGAIDLTRLDERSYGDFRLAALADRSSEAAPARYRFEFDGGRLTAARAWGDGADLVFEADAADESGCITRSLASLTESLRSLGRVPADGADLPVQRDDSS